MGEALTDPLVVRLVNVLVHTGVVLEAMNPVDANVVKRHVQHRRDQQPRPAIVADVLVQQALAADLCQEPGQCEDVDDGDGGQRRLDLLADLVLQEARMVLEPPVEDEVVGEGAEDEVERAGADLCDDQQRDDLAVDIVARPQRGGRAVGGGQAGICRLCRRVAEAGARVRQGPGVGLIQNEGIEELKSYIHRVRASCLLRLQTRELSEGVAATAGGRKC